MIWAVVAGDAVVSVAWCALIFLFGNRQGWRRVRVLREFGRRPEPRTCRVPGCSVCGGAAS